MYAPRTGMTDGCRVLLLRLLEDMNADGVVSIPRSRLASELGVAPARISERIKLARSLGFLDIVQRARPKVTAVYQATIPDPIRGTDAVPHEGGSEVRPPVSITGTDCVPLTPHSEVRMYPTQDARACSRPETAEVGPGRDIEPLRDRLPAVTDTRTAQTLIGEWIDHCPQPPPGRVKGHVAKEIKTMLDEGIAYERVRAGLAEWNTKGLHPSVLPSIVHGIGNARPRNTRQSETDDIFSRAMERAQQREANA